MSGDGWVADLGNELRLMVFKEIDLSIEGVGEKSPCKHGSDKEDDGQGVSIKPWQCRGFTNKASDETPSILGRTNHGAWFAQANESWMTRGSEWRRAERILGGSGAFYGVNGAQWNNRPKWTRGR